MINLIAGVDEAGVGPLAGPVVAAAVILNPNRKIYNLRDSKVLSQKQRERLYQRIYEKALCVGVGIADVEEINTLNIYHANLLAMQRAIKNLAISPALIWIDGRARPDMTIPSETIVHGDRLKPVISAASIIAKVTRDRMMLDYHAQYPQFNFAQHKGYSTQEHIKLIREHGACPLHREIFVKKYRIFHHPSPTETA